MVTVNDPSPHRVIGIGASAGGIQALLGVLGEIPADSPHAVCVVLHLLPTSLSVLPKILDRRCSVSVAEARDGELVRAGRVHVAPPDRHLVLRSGELRLTQDPLENGVRPAVDPLLRSLAAHYGSRAVAVVLSGALGDGADGALAVAAAGGRVLVQDPAEAIVASMPERTIARVGTAAEVLPARAIGEALAHLEPAQAIAQPLAEARTT